MLLGIFFNEFMLLCFKYTNIFPGFVQLGELTNCPPRFFSWLKKQYNTNIFYQEHKRGYLKKSNVIHDDFTKLSSRIIIASSFRFVNYEPGWRIMVFFFEAFDESCKGSSDPDEPEKHRDLFHTGRL